MSTHQTDPSLQDIGRRLARARINRDLARSLNTGRHRDPLVNDTTRMSPEDFARRKAAREVGAVVGVAMLVMVVAAIVVGHLIGVPA